MKKGIQKNLHYIRSSNFTKRSSIYKPPLQKENFIIILSSYRNSAIQISIKNCYYVEGGLAENDNVYTLQ